ncbi:hypothetical protein GmHk_07G020558 [Glycine max]|nr:hypothetical protein GmHk_07G020558 [Glycine max]
MPIQQRMPTQPQRPPPQNPFPAHPRPTGNPNPNTNTNPRKNFLKRKPAEFTPIPMPYADLLPFLLNNQMVVGLKQIGNVLTSRQFILEALREAGMIHLDGDKDDSCLMHPGTSHDVESCPMAEELLQGMMNKGQIEVSNAKKWEGDPFALKTPAPFPYKSDKAVPWKYAAQGSDGRKDASVVRVKEDLSSAKVTNIFCTSGMTCSGWIFATLELPVRSKDKGKVKADIGERNKVGLTPNDEVPIGKISEEGGNFSKKKISVEEVTKFLRIIQQSFLSSSKLLDSYLNHHHETCFYSRPWIHSVGVVQSMLHQKLKFVVERQLVIVLGEEDVLVSCLSSAPYVEVVEETLETSFQALEIVSSAYVESPSMQPRLSGAALMVARVMLRDEYEPGMGLG